MKIIHISGNCTKSTKTADHSLEMAGLRLFGNNCFIKYIAKMRLPMLNTANYL